MTIHHAQLEMRPGWPMGMSLLSHEAIAQALGAVVVQRLESTPEGGYDADLLLPGRSGCEAVLQDLALAAGQFGVVYLKAVIVEYASAATKMAISGALGGGTIGGSASKNPLIGLLSAGAGAVLGAAIGQFIQVETARYEASWQPYQSGWQVVQLTPAPRPQVRFGNL